MHFKKMAAMSLWLCLQLKYRDSPEVLIHQHTDFAIQVQTFWKLLPKIQIRLFINPPDGSRLNWSGYAANSKGSIKDIRLELRNG